MVYFAFDILQLIKDGIGYAVQAGIRTIFYEICSFIYGLIISIYDVFRSLCNAQLLDIEIIKDISQRVGLVLGLIMFFMVSFSFIQMVLDPEKMADKEMGAANIVKKVLIVIVMFGISPFIFDTLQTVQDNVISNNVLNRILLPNNYDVDSDAFGKVIALNLFTSFYHLDDYKVENGEDSADYDNCSTDYNYLQNSILSDGDFSSSCVTTPVNYTDENGNERFGFIMNFNYILALVVGIFVCYCLIMYTISVGMRVIQLAFLQMISPMAFIAYLTPKKDNLFSKWLKMYAMTFLDVFIRIAIISLGVFLISIILDSWTDITATGDGFGSVFWHSVATCDANGENCEVSGVLYIKIIMILAILSFMKKAPDLIKQLIPSSGSNGTLSYGLSTKDNPGFGMGKAVVGGATAGVVGGVVSGISRFNATRKSLGNRNDVGRGKRLGMSFLAGAGGALTGFGRGSFAGSKKGNLFTNLKTGLENQKKMDNQYENLLAEGGSNLGRIKSKVTDLFTMTPGQKYTMDIANNKKVVDYKDKIVETANKISVVQKAEAEWQRLKTAGASKDEVNTAYQKMKDLRKDSIDFALGKTTGFRALTAADITEINNDYESVSYLSTIKVDTTELNSHISSRNIKLVDGAGNVVSSIGSYSDLDAASISANNNQIRIQSQPDYASAVANDRAAGVHEHRRPPSGQGK